MFDFADKPFLFHMPAQIVFGRDCSKLVGEYVARFGRRAMLVTMAELPFVDQVRRQIEGAGVETTVFTKVKPNPLAPMIDEGAALARAEGVEVVVGLGGGSAIDSAKAIAICATQEGSSWEYSIDCRGELREATDATLPIVAVPTTAGTGSEVTPGSVIGNPDTKQKGPIRSPYIFPRVALVDPDLTVSMPPGLTAASGFDAFSHAFERFMSCVGHPLVESLAKPAMTMVVENLATAVSDGSNVDARVTMSWASCQSSMCVDAKLGEAGLHILGLPLSAHLDVPHGHSLAVFLPYLLQDAAPVLPEQCHWLAQLFGEPFDGQDPDGLAEACFAGATRWLKSIGLGQGLNEYGVDEALCGLLAESVNVARFENTFYGSRTREEVEAFYLRVLRDGQ